MSSLPTQENTGLAALPPLVEPGAPLSAEEMERYSRQIGLPHVNVIGQRRIKNARVLVIGAGGLGSPVLLYLAAAGIGTIGVIDDDTIDISNLQRQVIHTSANIGRSKVTSAQEAIHAINPDLNVIEHQFRLTNENALQIIKGYDLVVDGSDNFATRYLVSDATYLLDKPSIWGSLLQFGAQVSVFWSTHGPTYRDLYPEPPEPGSIPSCGEAGVLGALCGIAGALMAAEAIKIITGIGAPLIGRVAQFDALHTLWQEFRLIRDLDGASITALVDYEEFCGATNADEIKVAQISSQELRALLSQRDTDSNRFEFLDVRERWEHEASPIPGARLVPLGLLTKFPDLAAPEKDVIIILHCQSGFRSERAARILMASGYTNIRSLVGGADAWKEEERMNLA